MNDSYVNVRTRNVVKLLPAPHDPIPGRRTTEVPEPTLVDGEIHYEVEEILDSRIYRNKLQYLIAWKGYSYEQNSWEPADKVNADELIAEFYRRNPGAPRLVRRVQFAQIPFQHRREDTRT